jgi:hypothetical protein
MQAGLQMVAVEPLKEMRQVLIDTLPDTQALDGEQTLTFIHITHNYACNLLHLTAKSKL